MTQIIHFNQTHQTAIQQVPLLDLKRQYEQIRDEMNNALKRVNDSGQFVLGPEVTALENNLAAYSQVKHAVGCASGSDALLLALMALDIQPGDDVIVPSFTFFATVSAVTRLGANPVFADIDPVSYNISPDHVRHLINDRTRAIIPVHLFGQMVEMKELHEIIYGKEIALVEDSAQAVGAELDGRRTGGWGDMCALSFYPTKNLGGAGDGGMVLTNNPDFAKKLKLLRGHGMEPRYYHKIVGINSRLDSYQAAVLNVKLPYLDQWTTMRAQNAERYAGLFADAKIDEFIEIPKKLPHRRHVWNQYMVRVKNNMRDTLRASLTDSKIGTDIYYPLGLHEQECFEYLGYRPKDLPETYKASREILALPIFPELTGQEQEHVVQNIKTFCEQQASQRVFPATAKEAA